jgi:formate dehydrogenase major subunit
MVAVDIFETDTSEQTSGVNPADIQTEVFLLPACSSVEKEGSVSTAGAGYMALQSCGTCWRIASDLWIVMLFINPSKGIRSKRVFPNRCKIRNYGNGEEIDGIKNLMFILLPVK